MASGISPAVGAEGLLRIVGVVQDAHAQLDALIADIGPGPGDDAGHLLLVLAAEGAADRLVLVIFWHVVLPQSLELKGSGTLASPLPLWNFIAYR